MQETFITKNSKETQKLGEILAKELKDGKIIALEGDLGCGKTTFTQGFLKGLMIKGPYTSPTFVVMKQYHKAHNKKQKTKNKGMLHVPCSMFQNIYHIDAYRVNSKDILSLGWQEITGNKKNVIIIEWADRIKKIIPADALWIKFEWIGEKERKISIK